MIEIRYDDTLKSSASGKIINSILLEWNENTPLFQCIGPYEVVRVFSMYMFLGNCPPTPPLNQR